MKFILTALLMSLSLSVFSQTLEDDDVFPGFRPLPMIGPRVIPTEDQGEPEIRMSPMFNAFANKRKALIKDCRTAVVDGYATLDIEMDPESFSSKTFEDLNMTADQINELEAEEQLKIYQQLMPMELMVARAKADLDADLQQNFIFYFSNPIGVKKFGDIRTAIEELEICKMDEN